MKLPRDVSEKNKDTLYEVNVTIFIGIGAPPDAGLDGTLSICVTPSKNQYWNEVSVMS